MKDKFFTQAITVRYLAPTNTQGSRYKAFCGAGSLTTNRDYSLEDNQQIALTAKLLIEKLGWSRHGAWHGGNTKNGDTVFTCAHKNTKIDF